MTVLDLLLISALAALVVAWWTRRARQRALVPLVAAVIALAAGVAGVADGRWQAGVGAAVALLFLCVFGVGRLLRSKAPRTGVPWISGLALSLLAAVGVLALYLFPVADLPVPSGPHPVGVRSFELADQRRTAVLPTGQRQARRLLVRVWYPAQHVAASRRSPYFSQAQADAIAADLGALTGFAPLLSYVKRARTGSDEGAPLLAGAKHLPTVFYSHGLMSFLSQNTVLMQELASHGYVVYAVQHTDDAVGTVFPDGTVAPLNPAAIERARQSRQTQREIPAALVKGFTSADFGERLLGQLQLAEQQLAERDPTITSGAPTWLADRLFVHDRLQRGEVPAAVADVAAASALERVGELGMSFGGSSSGAVCMVDPRCAAGVNLDGANFYLPAWDADVPRPFLMLHSDLGRMYGHFGGKANGHERSFNDFSYERFEHAGTRRDIYRLQLKDTEHLGLSDMSWFMRRPLRDAVLGSAPTQVMLDVQNDFVRGFFDKHLRGIDNAFPQPQYEKYRGWAVPLDNAPVRAWWLSQPEDWRAGIRQRIQALKSAAAQPHAP